MATATRREVRTSSTNCSTVKNSFFHDRLPPFPIEGGAAIVVDHEIGTTRKAVRGAVRRARGSPRES
ncbi:hypothetical protein Slala05_41910 [Streptomyces lavendulae subsp. lavendulae]|nr:hypothetical protein Slala05_41910 [Streptomyces lavendulae subsp. lavendulae]